MSIIPIRPARVGTPYPSDVAPGNVLPVHINGQPSTATARVLAVDPANDGTYAVLTLELIDR